MSIGRGYGVAPPRPMSLLSWNIRTVWALQKVINKEDPTIVFLIETKSNLDWIMKVKDWCKFKNGLVVPCQGKSGSLAMLWKEEVKFDI